MDFKAFGKRMREIADRVEPGAHKVVQQVALAVDQTVVLATPVDTGRARANWQVQAGVATSDIIEAYSPGKGASTSTENTRAALEQGKIAVSAAQPGQEIHITNNLAYIGALNDGHSAQAPAGFVEEAVAAGVQTIRTARILE